MFKINIEDPNKLFFTSDTHFNHPNIIKYCKRPFESGSEMMKTLIDNWNSVVPEDGIVIHCGDFILAHDIDSKEYDRIAKKLNGKIYLVRGNHDYKTPTIIPDKSFEAVVDLMTVAVDGVRIYAQHYPCLSFNGDYQVFGHIHTRADGLAYGIDGRVNDILAKNQYDVGVDQNGYKPISYWELMQKFLEKANK